jgi:hypothetical protein
MIIKKLKKKKREKKLDPNVPIHDPVPFTSADTVYLDDSALLRSLALLPVRLYLFPFSCCDASFLGAFKRL